MRFGKISSILTMVVVCCSLTPPVEAAKKKAKANGGAVRGIVVRHHGKTPVGGASVHFAVAHHRAKHVKHARKAGAKKVAAAKVRKNGAAAGGTRTTANGAFTLAAARGSSHLLVAHKKHVGSGHARVTAGASGITIRLHKHHHRHSGVTVFRTSRTKAKSTKKA